MADFNTLTIGDLIHIPPVQTVIRLEQARTEAPLIAKSFVLTADMRAHLHVLAESLTRAHGTGCFVQGDFGSGKSHMLAALTALLNGAPGTETLTAQHDGLLSLVSSGKRLLPIDLSLVAYRSTTPLERIITEGIERALRNRGFAVTLSPLRAFIDSLKTIVEAAENRDAFARASGIDAAALDEWLETRPREAYTAGMRFLSEKGLPQPDVLVAERQEVLGKALAAVREAGFDGLVLVLDELSEFFRSKPNPTALNEDARMLQLLGEWAQHEPIWIIAAVQESIERTGDIAQATFRKIKDRFPVRLRLSTVHIRDLIQRRLVKKRPGAEEHILAIHKQFHHHFTGFNIAAEQFLSVYPVHPATLALLEGLGDLFSQHRGIVDFVYARVGGDPSRGIQGILQRQCTELLAPDSLYEHFSQRLMELSSFNAYPRHVIPHLDQTIDECLEDPDDRRLAARLVRMLVLYAVHPTVQAPSIRRLAELVACTLSGQDPDLNAQFIAEAILAPLAAQSRFLSRRASANGDPLEATFHLGIEEDFGKALRARIDERMRGISPHDTRIVLEPLAALETPGSWPGKLLWDGVRMPAVWRGSSRRAFVIFVTDDTRETAKQQILALLERSAIDGAMAIVYGSTPFECDHTLVWRLHPPTRAIAAPLIEYHAVETVLSELRSTNPADAPLAQPARETLTRLQPMVRQSLLQLVYHGSFDSAEVNVRLEPAARQVMHFERLVELAVSSVCESRYPRFADIAPQGPISIMMYQRMMDECIVPGTLSLRQAREKGLTQPLDCAARNLGLLEVRGGSYVLAPNPGDHPFLSHLFARISPGHATSLTELSQALRTGPYGVPNDMVSFVLCALAHSGLISLFSNGRTIPVEFLRTVALDKVDAVAPGELLTAADRETLVNQCPFLAPADGWASFGLRQQREAWRNLVKIKGTLPAQLEQLRGQFTEAQSFSALRAFDIERLGDMTTRLLATLDEVKSSYQARDGLERFLSAWRENRVEADEIALLKRALRFFTRSAQQFVFISHYARHRSLNAAARTDTEIARLLNEIVAILDDPLEKVLADDGEGLGEVFRGLQDAYVPRYIEGHTAFYAAMKRPPLSRQTKRGLALLKKLQSLVSLDEPPELRALIATIEQPDPHTCTRNLVEELRRAPVCDCGFVFGDTPAETTHPDPGKVIARALEGYLLLLRSPEVLEALAARAYALGDIEPAMTARLRKLRTALDRTESDSITALTDLLDNETLEECKNALARTTPVCARALGALCDQLRGRRLTRRHIIEAVDTWIGRQSDECIVTIEENDRVAQPYPGETPVGWWPLLHQNSNLRGLPAPMLDPSQVRAMADACERQYPAETIVSELDRLTIAELAAFIAREPLHARAVECAWRSLAARIMHNRPDTPPLPRSAGHLDDTLRQEIAGRLETLDAIREKLRHTMPEALATRIELSRLRNDPWCTDQLARNAEAQIATLSNAANDWLSSLETNNQLDITENTCIVIYDAVPIDAWLETLELVPVDGARIQWHRLDHAADTLSSMRAMLGIPDNIDPLDACAARTIEYHSLSGNEHSPLADILPLHQSGGAILARIALFDREAHGGGLSIETLSRRFRNLFQRHLQSLIPAVRQAGRQLLITSDHGVSISGSGLNHGQGGVYEQAIPRIRFER